MAAESFCTGSFRNYLGDGRESRIVDIPLNERWGARGEIEPVRTLEERLFEDTCDWCGRRC